MGFIPGVPIIGNLPASNSSRWGEGIGETVTTSGLVVEQRTHHQITGEPMKFLTLADYTGIVETELFAKTYRSYGLSLLGFLGILRIVKGSDSYR